MEDFIYNCKIKIIKLIQSLTNCDHSYNKLIDIRIINTSILFRNFKNHHIYKTINDIYNILVLEKV